MSLRHSVQAPAGLGDRLITRETLRLLDEPCSVPDLIPRLKIKELIY